MEIHIFQFIIQASLSQTESNNHNTGVKLKVMALHLPLLKIPIIYKLFHGILFLNLMRPRCFRTMAQTRYLSGLGLETIVFQFFIIRKNSGLPASDAKPFHVENERYDLNIPCPARLCRVTCDWDSIDPDSCDSKNQYEFRSLRSYICVSLVNRA